MEKKIVAGFRSDFDIRYDNGGEEGMEMGVVCFIVLIAEI